MTTLTINGVITLGKLLQMFRQMKNIDQTEMGHLIGASRATVSAWERDEREPSFSQVVAWARITEQPLDALVGAAEATDQKVRGSSPFGRTQSVEAADALFWSIVGCQGFPDTLFPFPCEVAR